MASWRIVGGRIVGVPNRELLGEDAVGIGTVIGSFVGRGSLVITGRDYAPASRMIKRALAAGLMAAGVDVMDIHSGVVGEIAFAIKRFGGAGGVYVSQYPLEPPAVQIRVFAAPGREVGGETLRRVLGVEPVRVDPYEAGWLVYAEYMHDLYAAAVKSYIDLGAAGRRLRVAVSAAQGPFSRIAPLLLDDLAADYVLTGMARPPSHKPLRYPLEKELLKVSLMVVELGLDMGLVFNNDASSLTVIDDTGRILLPEEAAAVLAKGLPRGSRMLVSRDCMRLIDEAGEAAGVRVERGPADPGELAARAAETRPDLAVNCRGEYIYPLFSLGYDAVLAAAKLIETLGRLGARLSELTRPLSRHYREETIEKPLAETAREMCGETCTPYAAGYREKTATATKTLLPSHGGTRIITEKQ